MISEYATRFYFPGAELSFRLREDSYDKAKNPFLPGKPGYVNTGMI